MYKASLICTLCIAQYISIGFFSEGLIAILRQDGMSLEQVGLLRFMGFSLVFGFLFAPLIDKIANGRYKKIIITAQCLVVAILAVISFLDIGQNLASIILLALMISFISMGSTVASNAFFMKISDSFGLEKINASKFAGTMLGHIVGNGLTLIIYAKFGWNATVCFLAVITAISAINVLFYKENTQILTNESLKFKEMILFFKGKKAWLSVLFLQSIGICSAFGLLNPMLVDIGWELELIGQVLHIYGMAFGFFGSVLAGFLMGKFGAKNSLIILVFFQSFSILSILFMLNGYTKYYQVLLVCALMYSVYVAGMTMLSTIMMQKSPNALASEYSIQSSANLFFQFIALYLGMVLASLFGYATVVVGSCVFSLITLFYFVKIYRYF